MNLILLITLLLHHNSFIKQIILKTITMKKTLTLVACAVFAFGTMVAQGDKKEAKKEEPKKEAAPAKKDDAKKSDAKKSDKKAESKKEEAKPADKK